LLAGTIGPAIVGSAQAALQSKLGEKLRDEPSWPDDLPGDALERRNYRRAKSGKE
jgi:hypothetical protein